MSNCVQFQLTVLHEQKRTGFQLTGAQAPHDSDELKLTLLSRIALKREPAAKWTPTLRPRSPLLLQCLPR